jgi:hypothetical protein
MPYYFLEPFNMRLKNYHNLRFLSRLNVITCDWHARNADSGSGITVAEGAAVGKRS